MSKKTNFDNIINPANHFITGTELSSKVEESNSKEIKVPRVEEDAKVEIDGKTYISIDSLEKKTKRIQLLVTPTLHKKLKQAAMESGDPKASINNMVHNILSDALAHVKLKE